MSHLSFHKDTKIKLQNKVLYKMMMIFFLKTIYLIHPMLNQPEANL